MKRKNMRRTAVVMTAVILAGMSTMTAQANVLVGLYSQSEQMSENGGQKIRDGWIKLKNAEGASVWKYVDSKGEFLKNTTKDGYKVNLFENWYLHCPSAEICEVDEYEYRTINGGVTYPCSYDGAVVKNDVLGLTVQYTEADYESGYELIMTNGQDPMSFSMFNVRMPDKTWIAFFLKGHRTQQGVRDDIERVAEYSDQSYIERTVAGKQMYGVQNNMNGKPYSIELLYLLPNGWDLVINASNIGFDEAAVTDWINSHLTLAK